MSKTKKKTLDELIEDALVPQDEQPYEIPNNWMWLKFNDVFETVSNPNGAIKLKDYNSEGIYPIVDQSALEIGGYTDLEDSLYNGGLPVIIFGDHTKNIKWVDFKFAQGADGTKLLNTKLNSINKYYYYCLKQVQLPDKGYSRHFKFLKETVIPIAPLDEQKRIVDKIEILFAKIEEAKQLIEEAKSQLFLNQKAVMKEQLFGKIDITSLKESSEMYNDDSLSEGWKWIKINDLLVDSKKSMTTGPFGTALKKTDYRESGVPVIGIDSIDKGRFIEANKVFITEEKASNLSAFSVDGDDVIISRSGTVGELCVVPKTALPAIISTNIIKLTLNKDIIIPEFFVAMFLNDGIVKDQVRELCKGSTRVFLNQTILKSIYFPVPSLIEQRRIIEEINKYSLLFENIKRDLLINTDELKQSILSKAFKGELGTNDSTDEPAIELLKSILQEKL